MALIKSALELALEKTQGLKVDKEELRRKEVFNLGRVAAAKALDDGAESLEAARKAQEKALNKDEYHLFLEGALENLLSRLLLASDAQALAVTAKVADLADVLTHRKAGKTVQQVAALFQQYGTEVESAGKQAIGNAAPAPSSRPGPSSRAPTWPPG